MRRFLLLATACFLLIVIGLPCAALYAVIYTQSGLQFVVRHLPQHYGNVGVRIENISGTVAGGARASLLVIDQPRVHLVFRNLYTRVRLEPLLWQTINTPDTTVDSIFIEVRRPKGPPQRPGHGGGPEFVPRWLAIYIGHTSVGKVVLVVPGGNRLQWTGIAGSALLRHRDIHFYRAQVQMGEVGFDLTGKLHASDPLQLAASGQITWTPRGQPAWRLTANAAGDLDRLAVNADIAAPFHSAVIGQMLDLTHHWHWQAKAAVRDFDLRAWHLTNAFGPMSGNLDLSGAGQNFTASGIVDPPGLKAGSFDMLFDGGIARQSLSARRIDVTNIASGARALASGTIGIGSVPNGPRLDLRGSWTNFRWPLVGRSVPFRSSQGSFELSGLRPYDFHTRGLAQVPTLLPNLAPAPADVTGKLGDKGVVFSSAQVDIFHGHAAVHGEVTWAPTQHWEVIGQATGVDPSQVRPDLPGSVNFGFDVGSRGFKPNDPLSVAFDGLSGRLRGLAASGGGKLTHAGDTWTFQQLRIGLGRTQLALDGSIDRSADLRFALTAEDLSLLKFILVLKIM